MQNPSSNPASGRETYTQTIVQTATLRQPPRALIFHLFLMCAVLFFQTPILLSPCSCCLSQPNSDPSLLSRSREQTTHIALPVFVQRGWVLCQGRVWIDRLEGWFTCGAIVSGTGRTSPTTRPPERAQSAQRDEQVRRGGERDKGERCRVSRKEPGSLSGK